MKKMFISSLMKYIKKNGNYSDTQLYEIQYGLTSIYLTLSKIIFISSCALLLGIFKDMLIFMLFFNIIRTTAYGLHATKSWICLISSTLIFIGIPLFCKYIIINFFIKLIIGFLNIILIFKNSPADTKKRPIVSRRRRRFLKYISTFIVICFVICSFVINDNYISNCLLFACILENILISRLTYNLFNLSYNNYIDFLKSHPDFNN